jgi:parvulin-like peptidyl-prolyl isomerase
MSLRCHRFTSLFALSALVLGLAGPVHAQEVRDGIAAVVGKEVITYSQMRELVAAAELSVRQTYRGEELVQKVKQIRTAAINDLIDRQLILSEFKSRNLQIPDYFIDERINAVVREDFGGDRATFVRTLAANGLTLERFRQLKKDETIVVEMRRAAIRGNVHITNDEIDQYYRQHLEDYTSPEQLKLRTITIRRNEGNNARRQMIDEIREKIVGGAEFGDLARMYSMDDRQEAFGDWGWIDKRMLNESLSKTAFSLKAGEMSPVIELDGSYYLLYAEAKKPVTVKPLKDVRAEIEKGLIQAERQKMQTDWINKLRQKSYIRVY